MPSSEDWRVEVSGIKEVQGNLAKILNRQEKALADALTWSGITVRNYAKMHHEYHNRTHRLENSTIFDGIHRVEKKLEAWVRAGQFYSSYIEFGTRKMRARPFLIPALEANVTQIKEVIKAAILKW